MRYLDSFDSAYYSSSDFGSVNINIENSKSVTPFSTTFTSDFAWRPSLVINGYMSQFKFQSNSFLGNHAGKLKSIISLNGFHIIVLNSDTFLSNENWFT